MSQSTWPTELDYDYVILGPDGVTYWKCGTDHPVYDTPIEVPIIRRAEQEVIVISDDEEEEEADTRPPRRLAYMKCNQLNQALFEALDAYGEEF